MWAMSRENLSSGFSDQVRLEPACSASETSYRLEILDIETRGIIISQQRIIKALIRLRGCAGWSAPLLFAFCKNRFSHDVAHVSSYTHAYALFLLLSSPLCAENQHGWLLISAGNRSNGFMTSSYISTPGNVVRGNQKLCQWNPYGNSRPWLTDLQTVNKQVNAPWILLLAIFVGRYS